ncbi:MAG: HupE/UreJ family protein [Gammaproteobacteria bacterium]|nr:HupE/UreJ family protein [Gammaproteobacteria bacterium]MDX2488089.1 HupE/UreJ family protein [Gammaproteobacteria bacterium]
MRLFSLILLLITTIPGMAHEVRPGYLEITETTPERYQVLWKIPMKGDAVLRMTPVFPETCTEQTPPSSRKVAAAMVKQWSIVCAGGLKDFDIAIEGLQNTLTDVLARVTHVGGATQTVRLAPDNIRFTVSGIPSTLEVITTYLSLGIEHILLGIDHLLFVFALLLIVQGWRRLVGTITAFTVAHSITLAAATLGYVNVPQAPVEAVIALSILFLATEIIHMQQGKIGLAQRYPWLVAFIFGLLHGFGFAGALSEIGLPQSDIPLALLFFNVGVEVGQLIFVATVLLIGMVLKRLISQPMRWGETVITYMIGGIAAFWTIERVAAFAA